MIAALCAGAGCGIGLWLLWYGVRAQQGSLAATLAAVEGAVPPVSANEGGMSPATWQAKAAARIRGHRLMVRVTGAGLAADLRLLGKDPGLHTVQRVTCAVVAVLITPLVAVVAAVQGVGPLVLWSVLVLVAPLAAFVAPDRAVRQAAAVRRKEFSDSLTTYLDLVALRAASGSGVSEALRDAAAIGSGYGWRRLRAALHDARFAGKAPAEGLVVLGRDIGETELVELANQLSLVSETGAQTEATLRAKADALRNRSRAAALGEANARSTSMTIGQVFFAIGFLILLGFPALSMMASP